MFTLNGSLHKDRSHFLQRHKSRNFRSWWLVYNQLYIKTETCNHILQVSSRSLHFLPRITAITTWLWVIVQTPHNYMYGMLDNLTSHQSSDRTKQHVARGKGVLQAPRWDSYLLYHLHALLLIIYLRAIFRTTCYLLQNKLESQYVNTVGKARHGMLKETASH